MESLKRLRQERNLTQAEIAQFLGIDRTTYSKYETEASEPPVDTLIKLSKYFDVSVGYIVGAEKERKQFTWNNKLNHEIYELINKASEEKVQVAMQVLRVILSESK